MMYHFDLFVGLGSQTVEMYESQNWQSGYNDSCDTVVEKVLSLLKR